MTGPKPFRRGPRGLALALLLLGGSSGPAAAPARAEAPAWSERVKLSGSADTGFFGGGDESVQSDDGFSIWDARVFIDAELGRDVPLFGRPAIRNLGFTFEWNVVRTGSLNNDVGLAYVDLEGLAQSTWANARVGRFQIPFGEAYKLYSKGYASRTFVQQPVGGPWWWDEGVLLHGADAANRFGYVASLSNGDNDFNDVGGDYQLTGKLWLQPWPVLYLSASGLYTSALEQIDGALWLGEGWARPFGSGGPPLSNWVDGEAVPDDPDGLGHTWAVGVDAVVTPLDGIRIWLAGTRFEVPSQGATRYDRTLWSWLAEIVVEGKVAAPLLAPLFVGVRVDGVGTFDRNRGYLLDVRYTGDYGYNMAHLIAYTGVLGLHLGEFVTLRAEYSHRDVDLVRRAAADLGDGTGDADLYTVALSLHF